MADFLQSPNAASYKGQFAVRNASTATSLRAILAQSPSIKDHEIITVDLSNLSSVREAAKDINDRVKFGKIPPIRALLLNAALQHVKGQTYTDDGLESSFAVNYLANFLLVLLLLPSIDKEMGRVVFTASWTHDPSHPMNGFVKDESHKTIMNDPLDLAKPKEKDKPGDEYNAGMRRYGMSKTLMIMWMYVTQSSSPATHEQSQTHKKTQKNKRYELQRRLSASSDFPNNISVLAVDPGAMTDTELFRDSPLFLRLALNKVVAPMTPLLNCIWPNGYFRTRAKSAHDLLVACFDENEVLGKYPKAVYLNGSKVGGTSAETRDEGKQMRLWEASIEICGVGEGETPLLLR